MLIISHETFLLKALLSMLGKKITNTQDTDTGICIVSPDNKIISYNRKFADIFGMPERPEGISIDNMPDSYKERSVLAECIKENRQVSSAYSDEMYIEASPMKMEGTNKPYYIEAFQPVLSQTKDNSESVSDGLIISDKAMEEINETISKMAYFDSTVLIQGESGTGKTAIARHIHNSSNRKDKPFITINCGSIPENLIESELFGYASGAFTSASKRGKPGRVELADGGTLFLDEIGLLPFNLQAKFLQLIQEKTFTPVGALSSKTVDVRIIAATNEDIKTLIRERKFREDLYYRLRVIELFVPPLRERKDGIEMLVKHFVSEYNKKFNLNKSISSAAISKLLEYSWPGNVRELQYVIERIVITSFSDIIIADDIPPLHEANEEEPADTSNDDCAITSFEDAVMEYEKKILTKAYKKHDSSYKVAAALGLSQNKASRLLRKYGISTPKGEKQK